MIRMDHLFDQMSLVLIESNKYVDSDCSPSDINALENIAAFYPTVRAIHIVKNNRIWCSSLYWASGRNVNGNDYHEDKTDIYKSERGITVFALRHQYENGVVSVTSDFSFIRDIINFSGLSNRDIHFELNKRIYNSDGNRVPSTKFSKSEFSAFSSENYPYTILLPLKEGFSITRMVMDNMLFYIFNIILSVFITVVTYRINRYRHSPESNLKKAIYRGEIIPYYQPLFCGKGNNIIGVEVLARWSHPQSGIISPDKFIPLAEQTGLIIPLTKKIIDYVVDDFSRYEDYVSNGFCININICQSHLEDASFFNNYRALGNRLAKINGKICLEVTESHPLELNERVINGISLARNMGLLLSLDDFGTGNSNLSYIKTLQPDSIKIDKIFVNKIAENESNLILLDTMITLAKKLRIKVVAEGVETEHQKNLLISKGSDVLQGYYFSRPLAIKDLISFIKKHHL